MAIKITDTDYGFAALVESFKKGPNSVYVGVLAQDGAQAKTQDETLTLIEVAVVNEFGNDKIPERSFIRGWVDENRDAINRRILTEFRRMLVEKKTKEEALNRIGLWAQGSIQKRMSDRIPPPNAPSTIKNKGSDVPLIDTGQLRSAISYMLSDT